MVSADGRSYLPGHLGWIPCGNGYLRRANTPAENVAADLLMIRDENSRSQSRIVIDVKTIPIIIGHEDLVQMDCAIHDRIGTALPIRVYCSSRFFRLNGNNDGATQQQNSSNAKRNFHDGTSVNKIARFCAICQCAPRVG